MDFRKDVNGLRALAVIAVVIFHFNKNWLPGGFIGVDVFFVISGFLMTSIIFRGLSENRFSLFGFYKSRGKRIIPALSVMILVVLLYGWFNMFTTELHALSKHAASSLLFVSNILYWMEQGYFSPGIEQMWLLHTWSLSVEWQFYLLYPLLLIISHYTLGLKSIKYVVVCFFLISLSISIYASPRLASSSFYLLPTRAWEMFAGGMVFFYKKEKERHKLYEAMGIALIIFSAFYFDGGDSWPYYNAILPVLGAALVIISNSQKGVLSCRVMQDIGSASYSIYLWHWPIYIYMYNKLGGISLPSFFVGVFASAIIGFVSFKVIENNLKKKFLYIGAPVLMVCFSLAISFNHYDGVKSPLRPISETMNNYLVEYYSSYKFDSNGLWEKCNAVHRGSAVDDACVNSNNRGGVFLWGDSHAGALSVGIRSLLDSKTPFYQLAASSCGPDIMKNTGVTRNSFWCNYSNDKAINDISIVKPDLVIMAQRDSHEYKNWVEISKRLHLLGVKKVIVVGPVPQWNGSLPLIIAKNYNPSNIYIDGKYLDDKIKKTNMIMLAAAENNTEFDYVDVFGSLCHSGRDDSCMARIDEDLTLMSMDYGHLTDEGAIFVTKNIIKENMPSYLIK